MSKDRLLSDEELNDKFSEIQAIAVKKHRLGLGDPHKYAQSEILHLINTQKRLYAESVLDEVLVAIDKNIEASKGNLKYARDHNNSDRTIANWKGCVEGEKFIKDDVTRLRAEQRAR